jgi:hypothetical protein
MLPPSRDLGSRHDGVQEPTFMLTGLGPATLLP